MTRGSTLVEIADRGESRCRARGRAQPGDHVLAGMLARPHLALDRWLLLAEREASTRERGRFSMPRARRSHWTTRPRLAASRRGAQRSAARLFAIELDIQQATLDLWAAEARAGRSSPTRRRGGRRRSSSVTRGARGLPRGPSRRARRPTRRTTSKRWCARPRSAPPRRSASTRRCISPRRSPARALRRAGRLEAMDARAERVGGRAASCCRA